MIDEKYLSEKEMNKEHLLTLSKEELVSRLLGLNKLRLELADNLDEARVSNSRTSANNKKLTEEKKALQKQVETLWKIITKCLDFEDMLDDIEDTAEEIRAAVKGLGLDVEKDD